MKVHLEPKGDPFKCAQEESIENLQEKVQKLDKTVFFGNGKPGLTTQMATLQQSQAAVNRVAWITLAAVIGQLVYLFFDKIGK